MLNISEALGVKTPRKQWSLHLKKQINKMVYTPKCVYRSGVLTPNNLTAKAEEVQDKLVAGPQYSGIVPSPPEVMSLVVQLRALQAKCAARDFTQRLQRDTTAKALDRALSAQCRWINAMANGDQDFLTGSGFALNKVPTPRPAPATPVIRKVLPQPAGQVIVVVRADQDIECYQAKVTGPNGFVQWQTELTSKLKISELPIGPKLEVTVRAINSKGRSNWCNTHAFYLSNNSGEGAGETEPTDTNL